MKNSSYFFFMEESIFLTPKEVVSSDRIRMCAGFSQLIYACKVVYLCQGLLSIITKINCMVS